MLAALFCTEHALFAGNSRVWLRERRPPRPSTWTRFNGERRGEINSIAFPRRGYRDRCKRYNLKTATGPTRRKRARREPRSSPLHGGRRGGNSGERSLGSDDLIIRETEKGMLDKHALREKSHGTRPGNSSYSARSNSDSRGTSLSIDMGIFYARLLTNSSAMYRAGVTLPMDAAKRMIESARLLHDDDVTRRETFRENIQVRLQSLATLQILLIFRFDGIQQKIRAAR